MEGIVEINKDDYFEDSRKIVKEIIDADLSEELWDALTNEVMDTCLFIGGDFLEDNIVQVCKQYVITGAVDRFKAAHGV